MTLSFLQRKKSPQLSPAEKKEKAGRRHDKFIKSLVDKGVEVVHAGRDIVIGKGRVGGRSTPNPRARGSPSSRSTPTHTPTADFTFQMEVVKTPTSSVTRSSATLFSNAPDVERSMASWLDIKRYKRSAGDASEQPSKRVKAIESHVPDKRDQSVKRARKPHVLKKRVVSPTQILAHRLANLQVHYDSVRRERDALRSEQLEDSITSSPGSASFSPLPAVCPVSPFFTPGSQASTMRQTYSGLAFKTPTRRIEGAFSPASFRVPSSGSDASSPATSSHPRRMTFSALHPETARLRRHILKLQAALAEERKRNSSLVKDAESNKEKVRHLTAALAEMKEFVERLTAERDDYATELEEALATVKALEEEVQKWARDVEIRTTFSGSDHPRGAIAEDGEDDSDGTAMEVDESPIARGTPKDGIPSIVISCDDHSHDQIECRFFPVPPGFVKGMGCQPTRAVQDENVVTCRPCWEELGVQYTSVYNSVKSHHEDKHLKEADDSSYLYDISDNLPLLEWLEAF